MTTLLNALSYVDQFGQSDLITVAQNVQQDAHFYLGNGDDILKFQASGSVNGIDVRTGVGNDVIQTANGADDIWATGGGKKSITVGNGADNVHLDQTNIASSFVSLHDTDQAKDTVYFSGINQVNHIGGVGEHTIEAVGVEDQFVFRDYGQLFVHDVDNSVPGAFDFVTRGSWDGPAVAKLSYEGEFAQNAVHPHLHDDGVNANGFHDFSVTFDLLT